MKELKLFVCEHCGTQYKEKNDCLKCEKAHVKPVEIQDCKYVAMKVNSKGLQKIEGGDLYERNKMLLEQKWSRFQHVSYSRMQ